MSNTLWNGKVLCTLRKCRPKSYFQLSNFLHHDQQLLFSYGSIIPLYLAIYNYSFCLARGALECLTKYRLKIWKEHRNSSEYRKTSICMVLAILREIIGISFTTWTYDLVFNGGQYLPCGLVINYTGWPLYFVSNAGDVVIWPRSGDCVSTVFSCNGCTRTLRFNRSNKCSIWFKSRLFAGHLSFWTLCSTIITSLLLEWFKITDRVIFQSWKCISNPLKNASAFYLFLYSVCI